MQPSNPRRLISRRTLPRNPRRNRIPRRMPRDHPLEHRDHGREFGIRHDAVQPRIHRLLDPPHPLFERAPLRGQPQDDLPAVAGIRGRARHQTELDHAVDEAARVRAALADQQFAQTGEGQGRVVTEQAQHLGLRRSQTEGASVLRVDEIQHRLAVVIRRLSCHESNRSNQGDLRRLHLFDKREISLAASDGLADEQVDTITE